MTHEKKTFTFDLSACYSPEDVHDVIRDALPLPEYYGGNLDALYDVLTDPHDPWELKFTGCLTAEAIVGAKFMRSLKRMCADAAKENGMLSVEFDE